MYENENETLTNDLNIFTYEHPIEFRDSGSDSLIEVYPDACRMISSCVIESLINHYGVPYMGSCGDDHYLVFDLSLKDYMDYEVS
jgi:hypothetical protein